ncbi:MAG TPA: hypothetical protein VMT20_08065 [Terriglobia bacterium]|nr:hypothetical protein [Terriglobia bacterium]
MASVPQPPVPNPPLPPVPPRSSSNTLAIVLLTLGLVIVLSCVAIVFGLRFLAHGVRVNVKGSDDSKQVSIKTPFGGLEVHKNVGVTEASLGLPIYPGATAAKDEDSASVSLAFGGEHGLRIVAGKFDTSDAEDKVRDFYQDRLTAQEGPFTKEERIDSDQDGFDLDSHQTGNFTGTDHSGKTIFKIKRTDDERVIALDSRDGGTRIEMIRITKKSNEAN